MGKGRKILNPQLLTAFKPEGLLLPEALQKYCSKKAEEFGKHYVAPQSTAVTENWRLIQNAHRQSLEKYMGMLLLEVSNHINAIEKTFQTHGVCEQLKTDFDKLASIKHLEQFAIAFKLQPVYLLENYFFLYIDIIEHFLGTSITHMNDLHCFFTSIPIEQPLKPLIHAKLLLSILDFYECIKSHCGTGMMHLSKKTPEPLKIQHVKTNFEQQVSNAASGNEAMFNPLSEDARLKIEAALNPLPTLIYKHLIKGGLSFTPNGTFDPNAWWPIAYTLHKSCSTFEDSKTQTPPSSDDEKNVRYALRGMTLFMNSIEGAYQAQRKAPHQQNPMYDMPEPTLAFLKQVLADPNVNTFTINVMLILMTVASSSTLGPSITKNVPATLDEWLQNVEKEATKQEKKLLKKKAEATKKNTTLLASEKQTQNTCRQSETSYQELQGRDSSVLKFLTKQDQSDKKKLNKQLETEKKQHAKIETQRKDSLNEQKKENTRLQKNNNQLNQTLTGERTVINKKEQFAQQQLSHLSQFSPQPTPEPTLTTQPQCP